MYILLFIVVYVYNYAYDGIKYVYAGTGRTLLIPYISNNKAKKSLLSNSGTCDKS